MKVQNLLFLFAFLAVFGLHATAQEAPLVLEYALVRTTNPPAKKLIDASTWSKDVAAGRHQVLESGSLLARWNQDSYAMIGKKVPVSYYEPRAEASQVQYIDAGFKIDCKPSAGPNGTIKLDLRLEQRKLAGTDENMESLDSFDCISVFLTRRGQTAVVGTVRGALTSSYLGRSFPGVSFGEEATVMFTVTVR